MCHVLSCWMWIKKSQLTKVQLKLKNRKNRFNARFVSREIAIKVPTAVMTELFGQAGKLFGEAGKLFDVAIHNFVPRKSSIFEACKITWVQFIAERKHIKQIICKTTIISNHTNGFAVLSGLLFFHGSLQGTSEDCVVMCSCMLWSTEPRDVWSICCNACFASKISLAAELVTAA